MPSSRGRRLGGSLVLALGLSLLGLIPLDGMVAEGAWYCIVLWSSDDERVCIWFVSQYSLQFSTFSKLVVSSSGSGL